MAEEDTSKDTEDNPDDTPTDAEEGIPEEAPEDTAEDAPEDASVDAPVDTLDPIEDPEEGDDLEVSEPAPATDASEPPRRLGRPGRTAAIAVGAALAMAAVAVGAAWAIVAIADDDDRSARHEQRFDADDAAIRDDDRREQFDRDRQERWERAQRERGERLERLEELKREREERSGRLEELKREWQERRLDDAPRDGSARPGKLSTEECRTILSLGEGDDALTVLVCNLPQAEMWQFENEFGPGDGFEFRRGPRDLAPLFEMFEMLENFRGFEGWPFGGDGDGGFPDGGRGFWFDGEEGDRGPGIERFCFGDDGEMHCFGNGDGQGLQEFDELSEEEQRQLEEWMESFRRFGPGRWLEGFPEGFPLEDFLNDYLGTPDPVT
ncbi:MAG: hypothetical protein F4Z00_02640 [Acidimicrobiaceae bacterium]|nr:hypothetical protein [Acidimicrobiaceae bacterium]MXZ64428.1 hypothetical protein [Acidimicrobiaceae bacterium]MYE57502.1 hypothetical protein [Acidimicrobiaceae bacterium]MYF33697.1 hypothetical protein [Acidimicrobiaceae bacterium]MYG78850.1 hypothetical protein [Acidimicrobiaceae bacterium]